MSTRPPNKLLTLAFIRDQDRVLLGYKKRGFGAGRWNGFGGKVMAGETIKEGAIRELHEECGAIVNPDDFEEVGKVIFEFVDDPVLLEVHVFLTDKYSGTIAESEEMRPEWYKFSDIPYEQMWPDDKEWYPTMLENKKFSAYYLFQGMDKIIDGKLEIVDKLE